MNQPLLFKHVCPSIPFNHVKSSAEVLDLGLQNTASQPLKDVALKSALLQGSSPTIRYQYWAASVAIHLLAIYLIAIPHTTPPKLLKPAVPITVSIVVPPAPVVKPEPIIEPKPEPKIAPVIKPQVVKKPAKQPVAVIKSITPEASEEAPVLDATPEPAPMEEAIQVEEAAPVVAEATPPAKPVEVTEKMEPPKFGVAYLNNPAPDYPGMSRRAGEQGRVLLKVLVSADGGAESVQLEQSSGSERLDQAAINAVKRWRFVPARFAGKALSAYVLVPVKFSLDS